MTDIGDNKNHLYLRSSSNFYILTSQLHTFAESLG